MTEPTEPENRKGFFPGSGICVSALIQCYANSRSRELVSRPRTFASDSQRVWRDSLSMMSEQDEMPVTPDAANSDPGGAARRNAAAKDRSENLLSNDAVLSRWRSI